MNMNMCVFVFAQTETESVMLFFIPRGDVRCFQPAVAYDPEYARLLWQAHQMGVRILAFKFSVGFSLLGSSHDSLTKKNTPLPEHTCPFSRGNTFLCIFYNQRRDMVALSLLFVLIGARPCHECRYRLQKALSWRARSP